MSELFSICQYSPADCNANLSALEPVATADRMGNREARPNSEIARFRSGSLFASRFCPNNRHSWRLRVAALGR